MDGGRRRRRRLAAEAAQDARRAAWYAWWRSVRFAAHFGGWERLDPGRFAVAWMDRRICSGDALRLGASASHDLGTT